MLKILVFYNGYELMQILTFFHVNLTSMFSVVVNLDVSIVINLDAKCTQSMWLFVMVQFICLIVSLACKLQLHVNNDMNYVNFFHKKGTKQYLKKK